MDEDFTGGFVMRFEAPQKFVMGRGDSIKRSSVGSQRRVPAVTQPQLGIESGQHRGKHHLVVTAYGDDVASFLQIDQLIDAISAVRSPIHVIAQQDDFIMWLGFDQFDQRSQRLCASMNIADGKTPWGVSLEPRVVGDGGCGRQRFARAV